jgi:hypothetical protein
MANRDRLIQILVETRELLVSPGNDFSWSSWGNAEVAVAEIDDLLRELRTGEMPELSALFAPSGPIQEVSASSGWGDRFLELSGRLDRELSTRS